MMVAILSVVLVVNVASFFFMKQKGDAFPLIGSNANRQIQPSLFRAYMSGHVIAIAINVGLLFFAINELKI